MSRGAAAGDPLGTALRVLVLAALALAPLLAGAVH